MGFSVPTISQINAVRANVSTVESTRDNEEAERGLKELFKDCASTGQLGSSFLYRQGAVTIVRAKLTEAGWAENIHFRIERSRLDDMSGGSRPWHIKFSY